MSYCNISPIFKLNDKYDQVHSVSVDYDGDLVVMICFEPDLHLPFSAFGFICQTLKRSVSNCELTWYAGTVHDRNALIFKAVSNDDDK